MMTLKLDESRAHELMLEIEELAQIEGYRNFAKAGDETKITPETQMLIESKAANSDILKNDGSVALTSDWIAGCKIAVEQIDLSIATGTAPIEVVSTTVVENLNADLLDGEHASAFADSVHSHDELKKDGSVALTTDWDIGDTRMIQADKIRARDSDGLALYEDGGSGIFVKDGGNVGIGTNAPTVKLEVTANAFPTQILTGPDAGIQIKAAGYDSYPRFEFWENGVRKWLIYSNAGAFNWKTNTDVRMTLLQSGEVGIGTATPSAKLAINGGLHVGGDSDPGDNNLLVDGTVKIVGNVGFYNTAPVAKPTVTGSKGGNVALASLITSLASLGLIVDNTT